VPSKLRASLHVVPKSQCRSRRSAKQRDRESLHQKKPRQTMNKKKRRRKKKRTKKEVR